jgi:hypothetical protein
MRTLILLAALPACLSILEGRDAKTLASLTPEARDTATAALQWTDPYWDARAGFLWDTRLEPTPGEKSRRHVVRDTIWYAVGLMLRDSPGDRERSLRAIQAVLTQQIDDPGEPYNGTFYRSPEEPHPPARYAQLFVQYDPNWRQFVGTTLAVLLEEYPDRLPAAVRRQMESAIERAVASELAEGRLKPDYSNIALMHGFLLSWAGQRLARPEWVRQGRAFAEAAYRIFSEHGTFEEYNSPTYYGVDLYALSLWRTYPPEPWFRETGPRMEARLWSEVAAFYNPNLKNISGPFDRAYGMDMQGYVSLVGLWLRTALGSDAAPFPRIGGRMVHSDDMQFAPLFALLGARIPPDALASLQNFSGEHEIRRDLPRNRVVTAWIGKDLMLGGEAARGMREVSGQYVPVTAYWRAPDHAIGWLALEKAPRSDARAAKNALFITGLGDFTFRVSAPASDATRIQGDSWALPGVTVRVVSDATGFAVTAGEGHLDITYREATSLELRFEISGDQP